MPNFETLSSILISAQSIQYNVLLTREFETPFIIVNLVREHYMRFNIADWWTFPIYVAYLIIETNIFHRFYGTVPGGIFKICENVERFFDDIRHAFQLQRIKWHRCSSGLTPSTSSQCTQFCHLRIASDYMQATPTIILL